MAKVVLIVDCGDGLKVTSQPGGDPVFHRRGFVAGLGDASALVEHGGFQAGVQVNLSPTFARRLLGLPLSELEGRTVDLEDLSPALGDMATRVAGMDAWAQRVAEVDRALSEHADQELGLAHGVAQWALGRIWGSGGRVEVSTLARESGYSTRHLGRLLADHVGLPPKRLARVVRLEATRCRILERPWTSWADLAAACGFADQSHLGRELRSMVGLGPEAWRAQLLGFGEMSDSFQTPEREPPILAP